MAMEMVPFGGMQQHEPFAGVELMPGDTEPMPGHVQGLYIVTMPEHAENIAAMFARWFASRPEIAVVDVGTSDKQGLGFVLLEWRECAIDRMFIDILNAEASVGDYTLYGRDL